MDVKEFFEELMKMTEAEWVEKTTVDLTITRGNKTTTGQAVLRDGEYTLTVEKEGITIERKGL